MTRRRAEGGPICDASGRELLGANCCESNLAFTAQIAIQKIPPPTYTLQCRDMKIIIKPALKSQTELKQNETKEPQLVALAKGLWCNTPSHGELQAVPLALWQGERIY